MFKGMSPYEKKAWEKLVASERSRRSNLSTRTADRVNDVIASATSVAENAVKKIPGGVVITETIDKAIMSALNGASQAIFAPALASVSVKKRALKLTKRHPALGGASPFMFLDLEELDKGRPRQVIPLTNAVTSAGASLVITGAEVSATVSGGASAGVIALAIAGDIALSLGLLGRSIAEVAAHYGYDPREPEEEIFLMNVLSYSTAFSMEAKTTALMNLSKLTQQMMRKTTWKELNNDVLVRVIQSIFTKLGINLTHKRLAQLVPIVGGVISAGLSYDMQNRALRDAVRVYRARYLSEKYDLAFDDWILQATTDARLDPTLDQEPDSKFIDIEAEVAAAIRSAGLKN